MFNELGRKQTYQICHLGYWNVRIIRASTVGFVRGEGMEPGERVDVTIYMITHWQVVETFTNRIVFALYTLVKQKAQNNNENQHIHSNNVSDTVLF